MVSEALQCFPAITAFSLLTIDPAYRVDYKASHDDAHWVNMARRHPALEAIYITAPRSYTLDTIAPNPRLNAYDFRIEERLYAKVGEDDWRVRVMKRKEVQRTWQTDPFGSDLLSAYGWNAMWICIEGAVLREEYALCWLYKLWRDARRTDAGWDVAFEPVNVWRIAAQSGDRVPDFSVSDVLVTAITRRKGLRR